MNRPGSVAVTAQLVGSGLRLNEWTGVDKETVMNQQAMRQAARRSALDVQAIRRKERAERERRLEKLAVAVLAALGDATLRFATRNAARCGTADGAGDHPATPTRTRPAGRQRPMSAWHIDHLATCPAHPGQEL